MRFAAGLALPGHILGHGLRNGGIENPPAKMPSLIIGGNSITPIQGWRGPDEKLPKSTQLIECRISPSAQIIAPIIKYVPPSRITASMLFR
jgi:hypothetical protein